MKKIHFYGTFDGGGHKISNLSITAEKEYQGLFGYAIGTIKNVGIESGTIKGSGSTGGIVGKFSGTIENCYNNATISATISEHSSEDVREAGVGGIIGSKVGNVDIIRCKNTGAITVTETTCKNWASEVGGISGAEGVNLKECANTGNVTFSTDGKNPMCGGISSSGYGVEYCYNTGNISCTNSSEKGTSSACGGICGQVSKDMVGCFSVGTVSLSDVANSNRLGEIAGLFGGKLTSCFALRHSSVQLVGAGGFSLTDESSFLDSESEVYNKIIEKFPDMFSKVGGCAKLKWEANE